MSHAAGMQAPTRKSADACAPGPGGSHHFHQNRTDCKEQTCSPPPACGKVITMRVSVIATVYNERASIQRLLDSLAAQTRRPDEVVICDGGSTDGTAELVEAYARRQPPPLPNLRLIVGPRRQYQPRPQPGHRRGRRPPDRRHRCRACASNGPGWRSWSPPGMRRLRRGMRPPSPPPAFLCPTPRGCSKRPWPPRCCPWSARSTRTAFCPRAARWPLRRTPGRAPAATPNGSTTARTCSSTSPSTPSARIGRRPLPGRRTPSSISAPAPACAPSGASTTTTPAATARPTSGANATPSATPPTWSLLPALLGHAFFGFFARWLGWLGLAVGIALYCRRPWQRLRTLGRDLSAAEQLAAGALVPVIRVVGDVAKMVGYPVGVWWRVKNKDKIGWIRQQGSAWGAGIERRMRSARGRAH